MDTVALPLANVGGPLIASLAEAWVRRNWGLLSFVESFLSVVNEHETMFSECFGRLQYLYVSNSAKAAMDVEHKRRLNAKVRDIFVHFQHFLHTMQTMIDKISRHYRLSKSDFKNLSAAINEMNAVLRKVREIVVDTLVLLGSEDARSAFPAPQLINNISFSPRQLTAKLRGKGGPAPLRTRGNADKAATTLRVSDKSLHEEAKQIYHQLSSLVQLQSEMESESDKRTSLAVAQLKEKHTQREQKFAQDNENLRAVIEQMKQERAQPELATNRGKMIDRDNVGPKTGDLTLVEAQYVGPAPSVPSNDDQSLRILLVLIVGAFLVVPFAQAVGEK